ncbi:MAG: FMN-binding protein [Verrucomicrobiales bacterium]|nr:FMN-binding protein [Verrucomicrobiota bacterium JB025]
MDKSRVICCKRVIGLLVGILFAVAGVSSRAAGAEKVYEKPSVFLSRHFGGVPKTRVLELSGADQKALHGILGHRYKQKRVRYWQGGGKRAWILDEIGKTEPITAGFIVKGGRISELRVLIYRESHGWEVSRPFFTKQFAGAKLKGRGLSVRVDGIVGATLSVNALKKLGAAALYLDGQAGG